jgi:uncharacterized delta-60 repeat protein
MWVRLVVVCVAVSGLLVLSACDDDASPRPQDTDVDATDLGDDAEVDGLPDTTGDPDEDPRPDVTDATDLAEEPDAAQPRFGAALSTSQVDVRAGGSATFDVQITRLDGHNLPVQVTLEIVGNGLSVEDLTIAAGQSTGTVTLHAVEAAPTVPQDVTVALTDDLENEVRLPLTVRVVGTPGAVDLAFGNSGRVFTPLGDKGELVDLLVLDDGSLLLVGTDDGDLVVVKLTAGTAIPDEDFGTDGIARHTATAGSFRVEAAALQDDGSLVVVGATLDDLSLLTVWRLLPDGSLDEDGFAGGAVIPEPLEERASGATSVAIDSDGSLIVVGEVGPVGEGINQEVAVLRLTSSGALDEDFGSAGMAVLAVGGDSRPESVVIDAEGRIVLCGLYNGYHNAFIARLDSEGNPDTDFASTGFLRSTEDLPDACFAVLNHRDGYVVVGYRGESALSESVFIARIDADGDVDGDFGDEGSQDADLGSLHDHGRDGAVEADGSIVVAGDNDAGGGVLAALVRFTPEGELDTSFGGGDGVATVGIAPGTTDTRAVALDLDGSYFVAGTSNQEGGPAWFVTRLWYGDPL